MIRVLNENKSLIDKLRNMKTEEIFKDQEAIDYCDEFTYNLACTVHEKLHVDIDDFSSEIRNISSDGDLCYKFQCLVYTDKTKAVRKICDELEKYISSNSEFNDSITYDYDLEYKGATRIFITAKNYNWD